MERLMRRLNGSLSRSVRRSAQDIFQQSPLDLRFAIQKTLDPRVTFTRASTGTFVGSDGLLKTATTNEARFDHNPTTGESLGLLVEEARTNLSLRSENFSSTYWVKTSCTITSDESTAPDGTLTADLWTNTASPGTIENSITKDATARTYTASLWVKGTTTQFTVSLDDGTTVNRGRVQFNLSTNATGSIFNDGTFTGTSGTVTRFSDSWVRLTVTTTTSVGTTIRLRSFFSTTSATVRIWGAQVEEGAFATSYNPATSATVTRAADVASITGANFSSFYNQTEGTVFAEANVLSSSYSTGVLWDVGAGGALGSTEYIGWIGTGWQLGPNAAPINVASSISSTLPSRTATAIKLNDSIISASGLLGALDTSCTVPASASVLTIGKGGWSGAGNHVNGTIKRLTYWPVRLADTTLQAISQP
jgi:hypothetical protein